jgi:hypothetical protein
MLHVVVVDHFSMVDDNNPLTKSIHISHVVRRQDDGGLLS